MSNISWNIFSKHGTRTTIDRTNKTPHNKILVIYVEHHYEL